MVEEILDELSPSSKTEVVVLVKPTQLAGTTAALIFLCGIAALYPGPTLFMQPTDAMVRSFSKKKLATCIKLCPDLKSKIKEQKSRTSENTILQKDFPGGSWLLSGSNSGASYRSESIKYLILDDFDGFEVDIEGEGSPEELADRRTGTFPGRKVYINSTTTIKDISNIERAYDKSSGGKFNVPCPDCGTYQYLEWGGSGVEYGVKFSRDDDGQIIDAWYQCICCQNRIDEHDKPWMMENGEYIHKYPNRKVRGFRYNALVTPLGWVNSWGYIAEKFLEANKELKNGNPSKYVTWLNSFMSEPYESPGEILDWNILSARAEPYPILKVPHGGLILVAGVDTQDNRLAVTIKAYGRGEESWLIYWTELMGDPEYPEVWNQLDLLLAQTYLHSSGTELNIISCGIDSGGHRTQAVYNYSRWRSGRGVFALKGSNKSGQPVLGKPTLQEVSWKGVKIKKGVSLWNVGTDTVKGMLSARFNILKHGPGYMHFPIGIEDEYYKQLAGEELKSLYRKGEIKQEYTQKRARIEAKDCEVYAYAAACKAGLNRMTDSSWDDLERAIIGDVKKQPEQNQHKGTVTVKSNFMRRG